ncbi:MAPEG family protein [Cognatiyoonia sp. IB215182]|uniref:MAPEG family protein n=1 Tax=Cognatiyoonia sp. IB215182 TaxID=3097353 RepID=UPI002A0AB2B5|nr:MAPEG family protein [Cognatiyoonia sp. IB215182]MDX8354514.1 MAPEG family protein [Cognatiyoonia sp. IB215182]
MITWILLSLLLFFVQTLLPPVFRYILRSDPKILATLGARDDPPETTRLGARAERAMANSIEQYMMFLPLAVLGASSDGAVLGAQLFVLSRAAYVPVYIAGIPLLRSALWTVGIAGLIIMALAILAT